MAAIVVWLLAPVVFAQQEAKGMLIYEEPGTSYPEAMEYRAFSRDNPLYSALTQMDGQRKKVKTAGVLGAFDYPPITFDQTLPETARSNLDKLLALERQFPRVQEQLVATRSRWERALSAYQQTASQKPSTQESANVTLLKIGTERYLHARLTGGTHDTATITHDLGVARIPLRRLDVSQIVSLNATSNAFQIGTAPVVDQTVKAATRQEDVWTSKLREVGTGILSSVQRLTGLEADTLGVWLLFAVFPLLIVLLVASNLTQGRKLRRASSAKTPSG